MAGAWGTGSGGGGWAEQVEEEEAKHGGVLGGEEFPALGEAVKQKPQKKKPQKMSLGAFVASGPAQAKMSDLEIRHMLPTTLRGREEGESSGGGHLGGAFKDYDNQRRGGFGRDDDDGDRRRNRDDEMMPSRADMADDWGKERKFAPAEGGRGFGGGGFRERDGGFRDREGGFGERGPRDGPSRADETDSWARDNKFQAGDNFGGRRGGFEDREPRRGGGFEDRERRGGFGGRYDEPSRADDGDWQARRQLSPPREGPGGGRGGRSYGFAGDRGAEVDRWERRGPAPDAGGAPEAPAAPAERPRLKLAPRTKPLSEAGAGAAAEGEGGEAPKKSNPFGAARPREEVLKEKGVDPLKEELKLEHDANLREETQEEKDLKKEIEQMRLDLEVMKAADGEESEGAAAMQKELDDKELHLLKLAAELDDKVKYAKKASKEEGHGSQGEGQAAENEGEFKEAKPKDKAAKPAPAPPSRW